MDDARRATPLRQHLPERRGRPLPEGPGDAARRRRHGVDPARPRGRCVLAAGVATMRYGSLLDLVGHTPLVEISQLSPNPRVQIFAKLEGHNPTGSVKDRIAKFMVEAAERRGELQPGPGDLRADLRQHRHRARADRAAARLPDEGGHAGRRERRAHGAAARPSVPRSSTRRATSARTAPSPGAGARARSTPTGTSRSSTRTTRTRARTTRPPRPRSSRTCRT